MTWDRSLGRPAPAAEHKLGARFVARTQRADTNGTNRAEFLTNRYGTFARWTAVTYSWVRQFDTSVLHPFLIMNSVVRFLRSEDGPTAVEYAIMLALIVLAISASVGRMATATGDMFDRSGNALSQVGF